MTRPRRDSLGRGPIGSDRNPSFDARGARVAIVEDEGITALHLQSLMSDWGYEVVRTLSSGEDAVASALEAPPDLMLMDIQLRGEMNGIEAASAIRAERDLPIIFLTAFSDEETLRLAGATDAYGFVRKPFDERDLKIAVEMALFRHRADVTIRQRSAWLDATLSSVSEGVIAADDDNRIRFLNPVAERLTGWSRDRALGRELAEVLRPTAGSASPSVCELVRAVRAGDAEEMTSPPFELERADGNEIELGLKAASIRSGDGDPIGTVLLIGDTSERSDREQRLLHLAHHDPLTGLPSRLLFEERLGLALDQCRRSGRLVAVILLDLDRFKHVNDRYGRSVADRLLVAAADRVTDSLRRSDTAARIGGDEIAVVLPDLESVDGARTAADKLVAAFRRPFDLDGLELLVTVSAGVSVFPNDCDSENAGELFERADEALHRAKQAGRSRAVVPSADEADPDRPTRLFERELRKALDRDDLEVHYQPMFALPSRRLVGAEALVRWRHPDHGLISAGDFLSTAVRSGLVSPITDWVLETACSQAASWSTRAENLAVAVNLNDSQLLRRDLLDTVAGVLLRSRLDPHRLQLEVAEHTVVERPSKRTADTIEGLRGLGARVTLDGFGSSHGAMLSLRRLRLDLLKVDRSLVGSLPDDPGARAIVGSALAGAVELEVETSAGGVENDRQLDWLSRHGCQIAQGFLLGPPCSADDFALRHLS